MNDPVHNTDPENPHLLLRSWEWKERYGEHFRRCTYCGGIHPDDLAAEPVGGNNCLICGLAGWNACFSAQAHYLPGTPKRHSYDPGGWYVSWADWKYGWPHKFYVDIRNRTPERLAVYSVMYHAPRPDEKTKYTHYADLPADLQEMVRETGHIVDENTNVWFAFWHKPQHNAKFYTAHLADPNISPNSKAIIEKAGGLRFHFSEDGKVSWESTSG